MMEFSEACKGSDDTGDESVDILDFQQLANEIDEMHIDLDLLQERLHITVAYCPVTIENNCKNDEWIQLYGSKQPDIRDLQLQTRNLEVQIGELRKCGKIAKLRIQDLQKRQFEQNTTLFELQGQYDWIHSKYQSMEHNHGKCLQRYRHNRTVYVTWTEVHQSADELKSLYTKHLNQLNDRPNYCIQKKRILKEINLANSRNLCAIQVSLIRAKELGQHLHTFAASCPLPHNLRRQQTLKDAIKPKKFSELLTVNFESADAFDWDIQSRKQNLKHGSVSEIEVVKPPALSWYGRVQKLMSNNQKPWFLYKK